MYDMYSWDKPASQADENAEAVSAPGAVRLPATATQPASSASQAASAGDEHAVRAVQVALDRRDNGGDADPGRPA